MNYADNLMVADRIRTNKYRIFNKELAHYIGLNESIYLSYLIDQDHFFNELKVGEPFYKTQKSIYLETTLKEDTLTRLNKKFVEMKVIKIIKKGIPAKNYFQINYEEVNKLLNEATENYINFIKSYENDSDSSTRNLQEQVPAKSEINNKYKNKDSAINISKDISYNSNDGALQENNDNEKINNMFDTLEVDMGNDSLGNNSDKVLKEPVAPPKRKQGVNLAPYIDYIDTYYKGMKEIKELLIQYILGVNSCRAVWTLEEWKEVLRYLYEHNSMAIPGAEGRKIIVGSTIESIQYAIQGGPNGPYMDFTHQPPNKKGNQSTVQGLGVFY